MDHRTQQAIETGEVNLSTMELVRNWCAHARIEKLGGTGIIEQIYKVPIGNHAMKCDHATAGGTYTWDFREAALDFYDRNCIDCKKRKAVGFPNLLKLVKERDDKRAERNRQASAEQLLAAEEHAKRRSIRARLRDGLPPLSCAIVDHIEEFDENRDQEHRDSLCESARLAPEHFEASIVAYIFEFAQSEPWFVEAALTILDHVKADPVRTARLALSSISNSWPIHTQARILLDRLPEIDPAQLPDALPKIIELANPKEDHMPGSRHEAPSPELLQKLWALHPKSVSDGIDNLLSSRRYSTVERAARGLLVLYEHDKNALKIFHRSMVSKFSRAELLLDEYDEYHSTFRYLRDALIAAFEHTPEDVDALVQEFITSSDRKSRDRAYKIYEAVLRRKNDDAPISPESRAHRTAFQRMLWAATSDESPAVLTCANEVFRGRSYQMIEIARAEIDGLVGAILLLDDRLRRFDDKPAPENQVFLERLERSNLRSGIISLMSQMIEWASEAAVGDAALMKRVVALFDQIPEGRDDLKGIALGCVEHFGDTIEGLKLVLPHLYYGLVGPSALVRSYAAEALGKVSHENIPQLIYEAFSVLLWDPYVIVHKNAVSALRRFQFPENLRGGVSQALLNLIKHYAQKSGDDKFVIDCVAQLAYELRRLGKTNTKTGQYLVKVLLAADPLYLRSEIRSVGRALIKTDGIADVLIKLIPHIDDNYRREDELDLLAELPDKAITARLDAFEKLGSELAITRPWLAAYIVEALARVGAWSEARRVAEAGTKGDATLHNEARRIHMDFMKITAEFEEAISTGRTGDLQGLVQQWTDNTNRQEEYEADVKRRNSRSSFPGPF